MDNASRLQVYQAQTKNVRMLDQARKQISRAINHAIMSRPMQKWAEIELTTLVKRTPKNE